MALSAIINIFLIKIVFSITEFRSLDLDEKHRCVMGLVPLLKPYLRGLVDTLGGLDTSLGQAAARLHLASDPRPPPPHCRHTLQREYSIAAERGRRKL